jgi:hypothetical protein
MGTYPIFGETANRDEARDVAKALLLSLEGRAMTA